MRERNLHIGDSHANADQQRSFFLSWAKERASLEGERRKRSWLRFTFTPTNARDERLDQGGTYLDDLIEAHQHATCMVQSLIATPQIRRQAQMDIARQRWASDEMFVMPFHRCSASRRSDCATSGGIRHSRSGMMGRAGFGRMCKAGVIGFAEWRIGRIQELKLTDEQRSKFDELKTASLRASEAMRTACSSDIPSTIVGQMQVVDKRLDAMSSAEDNPSGARGFL